MAPPQHPPSTPPGSHRRLWGRDGPVADAALLLLRLHVGVTLARSGWGGLAPGEEFVGMVASMGFPAPVFFAWCAMLSELVGGVLVALGLATRLGALLCAGAMVVATFGFHDALPIVDMEMSQVYLWSLVYLVAAGGGRFALDRPIRRRLTSSPTRASGDPT